VISVAMKFGSTAVRLGCRLVVLSGFGVTCHRHR
jgi:hypothetical protein